MRSFHLAMPLLLLAAALPLTIGAAGDGQFAWDVTITRHVQSIAAPGLSAIVLFLNQIGTIPVLIAIAVVTGLVLARSNQPLWALPVIASAGGGAANALLKALAGSPRPPSSLVEVTTRVSGFGFPSGHVMETTLLCGSLLYTVHRIGPFRGRGIVRISAIAIMTGMGFSRVYVGAHWPSDVLGGYLWGATFLFLLIAISERWALRGRHSQPSRSHPFANRGSGYRH